jgi:hypothetical protein
MKPGDYLVKTCPQCGRETTICCWTAVDKWVCLVCYQLPCVSSASQWLCRIAGDYGPKVVTE